MLTELVLLAADDEHELRRLAADAADHLQEDRAACPVMQLGAGRWRMAVTAANADDLIAEVGAAGSRLVDARPRIGFLFPGQGVPARADGGPLADRFEAARTVFGEAGLGPSEPVADAHVQLAVATASVAALAVLESFGVRAHVAVGHSLGELVALHWAGVVDRAALLRIVRGRARAMTSEMASGGAMATVVAAQERVTSLLAGLPLVVACENSPRHHVISGERDSVATAVERARAAGIRAMPLRVTGAFHSPLMWPARGPFAVCVARETFAGPRRRVISTVAARALTEHDDLPAMLSRQLEEPVRFAAAASVAAAEVDLMIEVGPGKSLTTLMADIAPVRTVAVRTDAATPAGLWEALAAAHLAGATLDVGAVTGVGGASDRGDVQPKGRA